MTIKIPDHWDFRCIGCDRRPNELKCYEMFAKDAGVSPEEYVFNEEGTLNTENGHFLCDVCYILAGAPTSRRGWKAP